MAISALVLSIPHPRHPHPHPRESGPEAALADLAPAELAKWTGTGYLQYHIRDRTLGSHVEFKLNAKQISQGLDQINWNLQAVPS